MGAGKRSRRWNPPPSRSPTTDSITKLLAVTTEIAKASGQGNVAMAVSAYVSFIQGKERAGQERALGAGGIAAGKFDAAAYSRVLGLAQAQDVYFSSFLAVATPGQREFYAAQCPGRYSTPCTECVRSSAAAGWRAT